MENSMLNNLFEVAFFRHLPWSCYTSLTDLQKKELIRNITGEDFYVDPSSAEKYFRSNNLTEHVIDINKAGNILEISFEMPAGNLSYLKDTSKDMNAISISLFDREGNIHDKMIFHVSYLDFSTSFGYDLEIKNIKFIMKFQIVKEEIVSSQYCYDNAIESI